MFVIMHTRNGTKMIGECEEESFEELIEALRDDDWLHFELLKFSDAKTDGINGPLQIVGSSSMAVHPSSLATILEYDLPMDDLRTGRTKAGEVIQ